ncbi:MAG: hypothetical protein ACFFDW_13110 [Candidatus Thorarchaeota archaeon]
MMQALPSNRTDNILTNSRNLLNSSAISLLIGFAILLLIQIDRIAGISEPYIDLLTVRIISYIVYIISIICLFLGNLLIILSFKSFRKIIHEKYFTGIIVNSIIMIVNCSILLIFYFLNLIIINETSYELLEDIIFYYNLWVGPIILISCSGLFYYILDKAFTEMNNKFGVNLKIPKFYYGILPIAPIYLLSMIIVYSVPVLNSIFVLIAIIIYSIYFLIAPATTIQLLIYIRNNYQQEFDLLSGKILSEDMILNNDLK